MISDCCLRLLSLILLKNDQPVAEGQAVKRKEAKDREKAIPQHQSTHKGDGKGRRTLSVKKYSAFDDWLSERFAPVSRRMEGADDTSAAVDRRRRTRWQEGDSRRGLAIAKKEADAGSRRKKTERPGESRRWKKAQPRGEEDSKRRLLKKAPVEGAEDEERSRKKMKASLKKKKGRNAAMSGIYVPWGQLPNQRLPDQHPAFRLLTELLNYRVIKHMYEEENIDCVRIPEG